VQNHFKSARIYQTINFPFSLVRSGFEKIEISRTMSRSEIGEISKWPTYHILVPHHSENAAIF